MTTKRILLPIACLLVIVLALAGCSADPNATTSDASADIEYNVDDYVTLGQYVGIEVAVDPVNVTDEDIRATVDDMIQSYAETQKVTDRAIQEGDIVNINYKGLCKGVSFEGGTAVDYTVTIGSGLAPFEGFEEKLIGAKTGDTVEVPYTLPEDFSEINDDLNGQDIVFFITVNSISEEVLPTYDDAFVSAHTNYTTIAEYEAALRASMEQEQQELSDINKQNAVWETILANATVSGYPENAIEAYVNDLRESYQESADNYGMTLEDLVSYNFDMDMDAFENQLYEWAHEDVKTQMVIRAIAKAEHISINQQEYQDGIQQYLTDWGYESEDEFIESFDATFEEYYGEATIRDYLLMDKVLSFVTDAAVEA